MLEVREQTETRHFRPIRIPEDDIETSRLQDSISPHRIAPKQHLHHTIDGPPSRHPGEHRVSNDLVHDPSQLVRNGLSVIGRQQAERHVVPIGLSQGPDHLGHVDRPGVPCRITEHVEPDLRSPPLAVQHATTLARHRTVFPQGPGFAIRVP